MTAKIETLVQSGPPDDFKIRIVSDEMNGPQIKVEVKGASRANLPVWVVHAAALRVQPEYANSADKQIATLKRELGEALSKIIDLEVDRRGIDAITTVEETRVHVLLHGLPLCGAYAGLVPGQWPSGHAWVPFAKVIVIKRGLPCIACLDAAERAI